MASILDLVKHYQHAIEKYPNDEQKILKSIDKLFNLGVTVQHLQETGVGRTVNALRKEPGDVGQAARALVYKWKVMVAAEESDHDEDHNQSSTYNGHESGKNPEDSDNDVKNKQNQNNKYDRNEREQESYSHSKYVNGDYSGSKRRHQSIEEEEPHVKKSKHVTYDDIQEKVSHISVKKEPSETDHDSVSSHSDDDDRNSDKDRNSDFEDSGSCEEEKSNRYKYESELKKTLSSTKHSQKEEKHKKDSSHRKSHEYIDKHSKHSQSEPKHVAEKSSRDSNSSSAEKYKKEKDRSSRKKDSLEQISNKDDKDKKKKESRDDSSSKHRSSSERHKSKSHSEKSSSKSEKHSSSSHKEKCDKDKSKHLSEKSSDKHKSKENSSSKEKHHSSSKEKTKEKSSSSKGKENSHKSDSKHSSSSDSIAKENSSRSKSEKKDDDKKHSDTKEKKSHSRSSHSSKSSKSNSSKSKDTPKKKKPKESAEDGIDCGSGASFAEALGMMISPSKPKKKPATPKEILYSPNNSGSNDDMTPAALLAPSARLAPLPALEISALPEISPNYRPRPPPRCLPHFADEDAISAGISTKNQRTKVYSGNKVLGKIPTLYEMCVQILQEHIDALEYTGGVPYEILKPVVDRATPEQLYMLEHYNPYLMEDTDHLWQKFCEKKFRTKKRQELESWREMYMRCQEEQEHRLKSLTANIKIAQEAKKAPIKQTKMAYVDTVVKPPRSVARKQAQHGTAYAASASPAARVAALAAAPNVLKGNARPPPLVATPSAGFQKPKKAPLMQKALQFMRGRKR